MAVDLRQRYYLPMDKKGRPRLSFSMAQGYFLCGECWRLKHLDEESPRLDKALPIGAGEHAAIAYVHECQRDGVELAMDVMLDRAVEAFRDACEGLDKDGDPGPTPILMFDQGETERFLLALVAGTLPRIINFTDPRPVRVEDEIDFGDLFPFRFSGRLDVQFVGRLREYKTVSAPRAIDDSNRWQLALYVLPDDRAGRPVPELEIVQVAKKPPYRVATQAVPPLTDAQLTDAWERVMRAAAGISEGRFEGGMGFYGRHDYAHGAPQV